MLTDCWMLSRYLSSRFFLFSQIRFRMRAEVWLLSSMMAKMPVMPKESTLMIMAPSVSAMIFVRIERIAFYTFLFSKDGRYQSSITTLR